MDKRTMELKLQRECLALGMDATQEEISIFLYAFGEFVKHSLEEDDSVRIQNFGTFDTVHRPPRPAVNPKTRERVTAPWKRIVRFRPSTNLKKDINSDWTNFDDGDDNDDDDS